MDKDARPGKDNTETLLVKDITQDILDGKCPELGGMDIGCKYVPPSEDEIEFFKRNIVPV